MRPHTSYRGGRVQDKAPGRASMLKAARDRRGMTRKELDREREAVRRFLADDHVNPGFTAGQLLKIITEMVT